MRRSRFQRDLRAYLFGWRTHRGGGWRSWRMRRPASGIPFCARHRAPWGTVYLVQSRDDPTLFKVGFTTRRTIVRRAELNRVSGDDMAIVATVSMPWARAVETRVLRQLRGHWWRRRDRRGTEWFHLRRSEIITQVADRVDSAADRIAWIAKLKLSWPRDTIIRRFRSGHPGPETSALEPSR